MSDAVPRDAVLCSASNQTYVMGAAVALVSAVLHAPRGRHCRVYLLDGGIRPASWRKLEKTFAALPRSCELIRLRPDMGRYAGLPQDWGSSVMTYARLALPQMVEEERIFYVDADLLVQADWEPLWETPLCDGAVVAAAPDIVTKTLGGESLDLEKFCLDPAAPYLQAGLLLIDLAEWRRLGVSEKVVEYLRENPEHARHWDQSALNVVLYRRWKPLPMGWNTPAWWADLGREGCRIDAPVLHFVGPNKPWIYGFHTAPSGAAFFRFLDRTAWKGWRPNGVRFACKMAKYRAGKALQAVRGLFRRGGES
ncbi:MAG: glycosyltransferase family 8 protein [Chthoniobacteraceae bacterium]|nr:glycosyltransferase family 8 protein [Chthoniobacteraceae bacterium]